MRGDGSHPMDRVVRDEPRPKVGDPAALWLGWSGNCPADDGMYLCTRDADHEPPHVACGRREVLAVWGESR